MVGGRSREPRPQYCRPGKPAIANHQTRHEVHNQVSRRRARLLMQGTEHRKGYLRRCLHRKRKAQTSAKNTTARSASAQPDERQPQAGTVSTTREFLARRHRAELFKLLVSWVGAHSTPFCSRAPSPTTGPHGDWELHPRSIADNGPHGDGNAYHVQLEASHINLKRPRLRLRRFGRARLQIQCRSRPRELFPSKPRQTRHPSHRSSR